METAKIIVHRDGDYLEHFGIKGQKWGQRNYQNEDGSLTAEGREHYGVGDGRKLKKENRYEYVDGSLTKAGIKEQAKIEKWYNSRNGQGRMRYSESTGGTKHGAYVKSKAGKSVMVGMFLGGVVPGVVAGLVTTHRLTKGSDFVKRTIEGLDIKSEAEKQKRREAIRQSYNS